MPVRQLLSLRNGQATAAASVPVLAALDFRQAVLLAVRAGARIASLSGQPAAEGVRLLAVLADSEVGCLLVGACDVERSYRSLTPELPQAGAFERAIAEQWGTVPEGHPQLEPVRFVRPRRTGVASPFGTSEPVPGVRRYFEMGGSETHEVAVGPVHAGVIEPGHFRFQCHGETVLHLDIALGYQHRGVQRALVGGPDKRTMHYMETLAGDTTVGHATAYCQAVEALASSPVPARAQVLRGVALELERLANHVGDLGALAGDVAYLPTAAACGRLRGDFLSMTALACGSRLGRGLVRPGGVAFDVEARIVEDLLSRLDAATGQVAEAVTLLWESPSVMARFQGVGVVSPPTCEELGLVGPVARACGVAQDTRSDFPSGIYQLTHVPVSTAASGDVFARAYVRWLEIQRSATFVREQLAMLPDGPTRAPVPPLPGERFVATLVEGWRGEICHVATTDGKGRFASYEVVDPSFKNWLGLARAMRDQQVSDFPLANKSFNLSYCGHDL
jgi:Ni,Fe-hydrogenase III large subunit